MRKTKAGLWGFALAAVGASAAMGLLALDQVRAENARRDRLARLREIGGGASHDHLQAVRAAARDLAAHAESIVDGSDSLEAFRARMEGELQLVGADMGFVLDSSGRVCQRIQYSNENDIMGLDLSFRRYYQHARELQDDLFAAVGVATARRGIYASAPVRRNGNFHGVAVVRLRAEEIESRWLGGFRDPVALVSPEGVVLASNSAEWRLALLDPSDSVRRALTGSRQFGTGLTNLPIDFSKETVRWHDTSWTRVRWPLEDGWTMLSLLPRSARAPLSRSQFGAASAAAAAWLLLVVVGCLVAFGTRVLRQSERERERLSLRLNEAEQLESLGRLAGGVAHDFNNVLTAVIGYSSVLEHRLIDRPADLELARRAGQAARRASETVRQLLAFARRSGMQARPLALHELAREIAQLLEHTLPKAIQIRCDFQAARDVVIGDANHLHQALLNLAINARDAMPQGGTLSMSTVSIDLPSGDGIRLVVQDTGAGIPAEVLAHVFEPFFTTKQGGRGTGLGLASVWGTVQRHGGTVVVTSDPGQGAKFQIDLPLAPKEIRVEAAPVAFETALVASRLRIAALDDDIHVLDATSTMVQSMGHQIEVFGNFQALETRLRVYAAFDLLILDLDMPDVGGLEVARWIGKQRPELPILVASGHAASQTYDEVRRLGVSHFLRKPFGATDLQEAIDQTLRSYRDRAGTS